MLTIADYSEFQGAVTPAAGQVVIIRAHNGWRADFDFAANRANAHRVGCPAVGLYQYLPASVDPVQAAKELLALIGTLKANEWLICDLEEGAGDQQPRWQAWRSTIVAAIKRAPWLYSGLAFAEAHNLDPDWLADYNSTLPTNAPAHKLWQNTDAYPWPWGKSDASVFSGTLPEFLAAAGIVLPEPVTPAPKPIAPTGAPPGGSMLVLLIAQKDSAPSAGVEPSTAWLYNAATGTRRWVSTPAEEAVLNVALGHFGLVQVRPCDQIAPIPVS